MRYLKQALVALTVMPLWVQAESVPSKVEVFYDSSTGAVQSVSVHQVVIKYYQLDQVNSLQGDINGRLPDNLDDAAAFMSRYANSAEGKSKINAIVDAYQGVGRAYSLGVKKLPAVVINERFVVYGTTDVKRSIDIWQKAGEGLNE